MERSDQSLRVSRVRGITASVLAFVTSGATFIVGSLPASAQYHSQLVNGGGASLTVAGNGAVTECSGLTGPGDKPGLGCKVIGTVSVPANGGFYHISAFGNSAGLPQGHLFGNARNGVVWGCSQTTNADGLPNGQCVKFNSVPPDPDPPSENQSTVTEGTRGSVNGESYVTMTDVLSTGLVFECTTFLSNKTSGAPTGHCEQIGTVSKVPSGASVSTINAGDVDFYYAVSGTTTTRLGQCVRDYNPSTLAPVGACIK